MKIIVKAIAGSHLFGTDTPTSDKDYKGVYLPDAEDILLGKIKKSVNLSTNKSNTKNTSEDIDTEFYSLDKFLAMLAEGQTVAFELLFTPHSHIIEKSEIWDQIISMREHLVHKKVNAFVGYCQQQANKYGIKGSRMNAIQKVLKGLPENYTSYHKINHYESVFNSFIDDKLIKWVNTEHNGQKYRYFEVCGRKFEDTAYVENVYLVLTKIYNEYGARAKQAELNQGIDWKAISHAVRVCHQAKELLLTGKITLPLVPENREEVLRIKKGTEDFNLISPRLEQLVDEIRDIEKKSTLPEGIEQSVIDDLIISIYSKVVKELK